MQAGTRRRTAAAVAALVIATAMTAASAEASLTAPGTPAAKSCTTQLAGYVPAAAGTGTARYVWDGRHHLRICVYRGTGGWIWGSVRLDGPINTSNGYHDRFTGGWTVQLQGCTDRGLITMATAYDAWDGYEHPKYDVARVESSRWIWSEVYTNNKPPDYSSYRVWARSAAGTIIPRYPSFQYALSAYGPDGMEYWYGPCVRP